MVRIILQYLKVGHSVAEWKNLVGINHVWGKVLDLILEKADRFQGSNWTTIKEKKMNKST